MADNAISDSDIQNLAEKLTTFSQTLSPGELAAFQMIQWHLGAEVAPEEQDVQGHVMLLEQAHARQSDLRTEVERNRQANQARASEGTNQPSDERTFWSSVITALVRRPQAKVSGMQGNN